MIAFLSSFSEEGSAEVTKTEKLMLAEHVFELRHAASGSFLDVRGFVADYIRDSGFLPHWKIEATIVSFRDGESKVDKEGAFASYNSLGYLTNNPTTQNFFVDRGTQFWKMLQKNGHYRIPELKRFGARTKVFLPSEASFDEVSRAVFSNLYSEKLRKEFHGTEKDVMFVIELRTAGFDVRIAGGPMHPDEVAKHLSFESMEFKKTGLFLDCDYYRTDALDEQDVPLLLHKAVDLTWDSVERLARVFGV